MKRHIAGKTVRGAVALELPVPAVRVIRKAAHVSQSQFAKLLGGNLRTCKTGNSTAPAPPGLRGHCAKLRRPTPKPLMRCIRDDADAWLQSLLFW